MCYNHDWRPWPALISDDNALQLFRPSSHLLSCLNNRGNGSSKKDTDNGPNYQETGSIISRGVIFSSLDGYGVWYWSESAW